MKISGISAVVTGGGSGLGAAAAKALAAKGARVALLDSNLAAAREVAEAIGGFAAHCDVTDPAGAAEALEQAALRHGPPRVLVNCAGISPGRVPLTGEDAPGRIAAFERVIRINLNGTLNMVALAAQQMSALEPTEEGERGVVVMTASVAAYDGQVGMAAYSASKGGIVALTLPAARELAGSAIRVNSVAPGYFETAMIAGLPGYVREGCASSFVYPKRFGRVDEYAQLVVHICENGMLNGETIRLDGGMRPPPTFGTA